MPRSHRLGKTGCFRWALWVESGRLPARLAEATPEQEGSESARQQCQCGPHEYDRENGDGFRVARFNQSDQTHDQSEQSEANNAPMEKATDAHRQSVVGV